MGRLKSDAEKKGRIGRTIMVLKDCAQNEHCEINECMYYVGADRLMELLEFAEDVLAEDEDAVQGNGPSVQG